MLAAPVLSSTYPTAIKRGADIYMNSGAKYNNSSINALGLATATDSLVAIKKLVFDDKVLTIEALCDILKKNWQGSETLRLRVKNRFPKYGTANDEADSIAAEIVDRLADSVEGRPNARGGVWRLGTFSIDWRWNFGRHTAASACGRLSGETLSQNASAAFGADREGYSAHLISASRLNTERTPNGTVVDLDIHYSAVSGESGLAALVAALRTFVKMGGFALHYNVLNVETLKAARLRPYDYPTLQVRVCGWNAPFASLSDKEKDEFIKRFEEKAV
jgi:formate C-acetyltransferase